MSKIDIVKVDQLSVFHQTNGLRAGTITLKEKPLDDETYEWTWTWIGGPMGRQEGTYRWSIFMCTNVVIFWRPTRIPNPSCLHAQ